MAQGNWGESFSSASYYSNDSYGSRQETIKKRKKDHVSKWTKTDLDEKNIFYNDEACSLDKFVQRVKERACPRRGYLFKCPAEIPDFVKDLMKYTKEALFFSYDEQLEEDHGKEPTLVAFHEACANLKAFDKYSCELMDGYQDLNHVNRKLLSNWCMTTEAFLKFLKLFLSTRMRNEKESEWEGQFRELLMNFSRIFFMTPESGDARKRELEINKVRVSSIPDIHYMKDTSTPKVFDTLLVLCVEVKQAAIDASTLAIRSFKANESIESKVLGQHGGELLLEKTYSAFEPKVLGMICHRSKIIFTYMDLKSSHYKIIVEKGEVTDDKYRCTIYYTRPFDFLIKSDRDEILEFLFWIGYVQGVDIGESETA